MIGGWCKFPWLDPQKITVKIDDKASPLTKMFNGQDFDVNDETYTFSISSFSRKNVHVLTSINYDKMSFMDKLKESQPRPDHDFGLSWIKKDGQGRVFYMALGHNERIYAMKPMLEHLLAGMQYALGDLKADDSPSEKELMRAVSVTALVLCVSSATLLTAQQPQRVSPCPGCGFAPEPLAYKD